MVVRVRHARRLRQLHRRADTSLGRHAIRLLELRRDGRQALVAHIGKDLPGLERLAAVVEHDEVVPLISLVLERTRARHRVPVRLPVEHADALAARHIREALHDRAQARRLSLHRRAEAADALRLRIIRILRLIEILIRIAERRLDDHDILAVA